MATERTAGTGIVNADECVAILREIVEATDGTKPLTRHLRDKYQAETYSLPWQYEISSALVERALLALGLDYPTAPKPQKLPNLPTPTQAEVLAAMTARAEQDEHVGLLQVMHRSDSKDVITPSRAGYLKVKKSTYEALCDYKWIKATGERDWHRTFYAITDAGREALARYQAKQQQAAAV